MANITGLSLVASLTTLEDPSMERAKAPQIAEYPDSVRAGLDLLRRHI